MTSRALTVLLEELIDYAGLFPPAALSMQDAVSNYARYREEEYAWALGRFVVPADRVNEVPDEFPISVLWNGGEALASLRSDATLETKATTAGDIERIAANAAGRTVYVEITELALIEAVARYGLRAKIRTGGVTSEAFPAIADVASFLRACRVAGVPFKATAGLHHPLRCVKPLTYAPDAPRGTMHGFLNVFLAATLPDHAGGILAEEDPDGFHVGHEAITWRGVRATTAAISTTRRDFASSFGSCSFEEPIDDLKELGWL